LISYYAVFVLRQDISIRAVFRSQVYQKLLFSDFTLISQDEVSIILLSNFSIPLTRAKFPVFVSTSIA